MAVRGRNIEVPSGMFALNADYDHAWPLSIAVSAIYCHYTAHT